MDVPRVSVEEINSGPSVPQEMTFDTSLAYLLPRQWLADYDLANPESGGLGPPRRDCRAQRQICIAHPSESRFATCDPNFRASERACIRACMSRVWWLHAIPLGIRSPNENRCLLSFISSACYFWFQVNVCHFFMGYSREILAHFSL